LVRSEIGSDTNTVAQSAAMNQMQQIDGKYTLGMQEEALSANKSYETIEAAVERARAQRITSGN